MQQELRIRQHADAWDLRPAGMDALGTVFVAGLSAAAGDPNPWLWLFDLTDGAALAVRQVRRYVWASAPPEATAIVAGGVVHVYFVLFERSIRAYCETNFANWTEF